jgi:hypothetical protein
MMMKINDLVTCHPYKLLNINNFLSVIFGASMT